MGDPVVVRKLLAVGPGGTLRLDQARQAEVDPKVLPPDAATLAPAAAGTQRDPNADVPAADDAPALVSSSDRYATIGKVGAGSMGEVVLAKDQHLLRKVAFKRILPQLANDKGIAARFLSEAQITAQLDHPNIVPIYDLDVPDEGPLGYSMKLVRGRTLGAMFTDDLDAIRAGDAGGERVRLIERLDAFLSVCDAIAHAHDKGVLHRDLKPDNIMIGDRGEVYVMDWGICRLLGVEADTGEEPVVDNNAATGHTQYGAIIGTPEYMSPEQAQGRVPELDRRSDLYALGLILAELVSLVPALRAPTIKETVARAAEGETRVLAHAHRKVRIPRELGAIVAKATATLPVDRYDSVGAFAADIRTYLRGDAVAARPDTPLQAFARWLGRHRVGAFFVASILLLVAAVVIAVVLFEKERALGAANAHDARVQSFILATSERAHDIDNHFYRYEERLAHFAGRSESIISHVGPAAAKVYLASDFDDPTRAPPDTAPSTRYRRPASIDHPVFVLEPGLDKEGVSERLSRLARMRPILESLLVDTDDDDLDGLGREALRARLLGPGVAVLRTFVTLEDGIHIAYPGAGGYRAGFDGRTRPAYLASSGREDVVWGSPYIGKAKEEVLLAASLAIIDADDHRLGVAALELTFDDISKLLVMADAPYVEAAYLVNASGDVVIHAGEIEGIGTADPSDDILTLEPLPIPQVRKRLADRVPGHLELEDEGENKLIAYFPLDSVGWSYVVVADERTLAQSR